MTARRMSEVLTVRVFEEKKHIALTYRVNQRGIDHLCLTLFGKTTIFTDQSEWSGENVALASREQSRIEDAFRTMKNPHFVTFSPSFHWTDQKIRVHAFYCVLALTMVSLLQRHLHHQDIDISTGTGTKPKPSTLSLLALLAPMVLKRRRRT